MTNQTPNFKMTKAGHKIKEVPFYGQDWDLLRWEKMGFSSKNEAKYWEKSSCAILCLKMARESYKPTKKIKVNELINEGLKIGAYTHKNGWDHGGLVRLAKNHGLGAKKVSRVTKDGLKSFLDEGCLAQVSVKWAFENKKSLKEKLLFWKKYGGHMALVIGYSDDGFIVHHTSIIPEYNWRGRLVLYHEFEQSFTGRCIVLKMGDIAMVRPLYVKAF